jgi:type I restriction enzyme M protein
MTENTLQFINELENQFSKKEINFTLISEVGKLHALYAAMEMEKYKTALSRVATREDVKNAGSAVKKMLQELYLELEKNEPSLVNIFINDSFSMIDEKDLYKLVVLFERYGLTKDEYQSKEMIVSFFNNLLKEFINEAKGFEFTPDGLIQLMVESIKPLDGSIYDGTAGIANILVQAYTNAVNKNGEVTVFGQELNQELYVLGKLNLFLNHILPERGNLHYGDTIREPKWVENGRIQQFDYVLMNYPFGVRDWGYEFAVNDPYGRFELYDIPSKAHGDYAFILHALASLKSTGKAALVVPFGTLVRGAAERKIRSILLKDDVIESIIALPSNLFVGTGIQVALLILNKNKPDEKKRKVQFINAEGDYERTRTQKFLMPEHIDKIVDVLDRFENIERYSRIVPIEEIEENQFDLNPSLYFVNIELETEFGKVLFNRKKYETETKNLVPIREIAEVIRGVNLPSRRQIENADGELYPVIQIRDVEDGEIQFDKIDKFPIQTRDIERVTAKPGDILVSSRGTQQKIAIVPEHTEQVLVSSMFVIIRLTSDKINPLYVKRILESPAGQYFFEVNQSGSVVTVLTPNDIKTIEIPLLSIDQQNEFVSELEKADDIIRKAQEERKNLYFNAYQNVGFGTAIRKN